MAFSISLLRNRDRVSVMRDDKTGVAFFSSFHILSQILFFKRVLLFRLVKPEAVKRIPILPRSDGLFVANETFDQIWDTFFKGKMFSLMHNSLEISESGAGCPASGCNHCDQTVCFYSDFMVKYWNHPRCD